MPGPVAAFEWLSIILLALGVVLGGIEAGSAFLELLALALQFGLVLAVSRGRSRVARWVFTLVYALGFALMIYWLSSGLLLFASVTWPIWLIWGGSALQLALLWNPATSLWLRQSRSVVDQAYRVSSPPPRAPARQSRRR